MRPHFHSLYLYWKWTWSELLPFCSVGGFCLRWAPSGHPRQAVTAVPSQWHPNPLRPCSRSLPGTCQEGARGSKFSHFTGPVKKQSEWRRRWRKASSVFHWLPTSVRGCFSSTVDLGIYRGESFFKSCPAETMTGYTATVTLLPSIPNLYKSSFDSLCSK